MPGTDGGPAEKSGWPDATWLSHLQADAMLIKRPVVEIDGKPAAIGFKEDRYGELFAG